MSQFLLYFWNRRGYEDEGRNLIREALDRTQQLPEFQGNVDRGRLSLTAEAWQGLAMLAYSRGDNVRAIDAAKHAASVARQLGDKRLLALALAFEASGEMILGRREDVAHMLEEGMAAAEESGDKFAIGLPLALFAQAIAVTTGDPQAARAAIEQGRELLMESGDDWGTTMSLMGSALLAKTTGDYALARGQFNTIEPIFRDLGDQHRINMVKSELAHIERFEGHYEQAEAMYRETIREWQRIGHRAAVAHQLECFAFLSHAHGQAERAASLYGAAEALRDKIGIPMTQMERDDYDRQVAALQASMDPEAFARAWAGGRGMSMDQAVRFAVLDGISISTPN
jgi:tetratricopeptide (TPR) repeat protein